MNLLTASPHQGSPFAPWNITKGIALYAYYLDRVNAAARYEWNVEVRGAHPLTVTKLGVQCLDQAQKARRLLLAKRPFPHHHQTKGTT